MKRVFKFVIIVLFIGLAALGIFPAPSLAQSPGPAAEPANTPDTVAFKSEITAIPLPEVGSEMQQTSIVLREIRNRLKEIDFSMEVDSLLPGLDSSFLHLSSEVFEDSLKGLSLRGLEDVVRDFTKLNNQLEAIQKRLDEERQILAPDMKQVNVLLEQWSKTKEQKTDGGIPPPVAKRLEAIIEGISNLKGDLNQKLNELIIAENRLAGSLIVVEEALEIVREQLQTQQQNIFAADSPPFWAVLQRKQDSTSIRQEAKRVWMIQEANFRDFADQYTSNYQFQLILFAALFVLLHYFRTRVDKWTEEKREATSELSMKIIQRPLATALLITLLITPFNYPEAPQVAVRLIYLLSIVPMLYLIPLVTPLLDRRYIYFFGVLFVASELSSFFERYYIIDRIALLCFDLIAVVLYYVTLRSSSPALVMLRKKQMYLAILGLRILWMMHTIGILSNLFGMMVMSKILSHGALVVVFSGIMIYAGALVIKSLFNLFMYSDESRLSRVVELYPDEIRKAVHQIINFSAVVFYLYVILNEFLLFRPLMNDIGALMRYQWTIGDVSISIGRVLAFFLTLWVAMVLSKVIRIVLQDEVLSRMDMKRGIPGAISMLVRIALITLGFILAFAAAGIELSNIAIIFGALGVGIGFGLQNIFNNLISGIIIAFERPIQIGDVLQIASLNLMGTVQEIGIRSSVVKTFDGAEVVVPNGNIISNEMINWTLSDRKRRQEILIGVKYGSDLNHVLEILKEVVANHENVMKNPEPLIVFTGFGDSSLNFRVLFWTHFDVGLTTKSAVGLAIDEAFKEVGIEIPFPQRTLHLKTVPEELSQGAFRTNEGAPRTPTTAAVVKKPKDPGNSGKSDVGPGEQNTV